MKKYKIEIEQTETFVVDILAENEEQAQEMATEYFSKIKNGGMEHMYQIGDTDWNTGTIYDVTNTDDPFNPMNG